MERKNAWEKYPEGKKREERILYSKTKPRTQLVWNRI